jgi:hypothetical protein
VGADPVNKTDPSGEDGVVQWVVDSAKMVASDLAELGEDIRNGDFDNAFGGMPPTLGGGLVSGGASAVAGTARIVGAVSREASVSRAAAAELRSAARVTPRITRDGTRAVEMQFRNRSIKDVSLKRVKEFVPNNHPKAPPGQMQRMRFNDALDGSKGYKRAPTAAEARITRMPERPGIVCRFTGYFCGK